MNNRPRIFKIVFFCVVFNSIDLSAQLNHGFIDLYAQGLEEYKNERWSLADSLFTESLNLWPNENTYYNRALTRFQLSDAKRGCEDVTKAVLLGDSASGYYYCKYCGVIDTIYRNAAGTIVRNKKSAEKRIIQLRSNDSLLIDSTVFNLWPHQEIFTIVDEMPSFPGGENKLFEYLQKEIFYPIEARRKKIEGRLYVTFIVRPDGSLEDIRILRSLFSSCDIVALQAVKKMPPWSPGKNGGTPVSVQYNLPINFILK